MRHLILISLLLAPLTAIAADYSDAPLIVVGGRPEQAQAAATPPEARPKTNGQYAPWEPGFPEWAVSKAGRDTTGQPDDAAAPAPSAPAAPEAPQAQSTSNPTNAASPASPPAPAGALWPRDTAKIFMTACVGFHPELIPACGCTISNLMLAMRHDEFLALSADGSIENDTRLVKIRHQCVGAQKKQG